MKTTTRRNELLSTIVLDPTLHPVVDALAGLERLVPVAPSETESLAIFRNQLPGLLALRGRGQARGRARGGCGSVVRQPRHRRR